MSETTDRSEPDCDDEPERAGDGSDRERDEGERAGTDHLADVRDGCGCVEVWEHLAERRRND